MALAGRRPKKTAHVSGFSLRGKLVLAALALIPLNWLVQVARKPTELAGLVLPTTSKSPAETWEAYGDDFVDHATSTMTPEFLAALAQVESAGNPAARTYWRWRWTLDPSRWFAPASSAVGLMQLTDATFERCREFCVRGGEVRREGSWHDARACWFNGFYNRLVPSHAVEVASACLHNQVESILREGGRAKASPRLKRDVAAVSHLCGPNARAVAALVRTGAVPAGLRCGDHDPRQYLSQIRALEVVFARLRRGG